MTAQAVVSQLLQGKSRQAIRGQGQAFAPANIALAKYWGKRDSELNLPMTSSLSISLAHYGASTSIALVPGLSADRVILNGQVVATASTFYQRLAAYLDYIRTDQGAYYQVTTTTNLPVAAGLASSACGFAALVLALDDYYGWQLDSTQLSILARLGSGSAARSVLPGFMHWQAGEREDGMDSYAIPLSANWTTLRLGLVMISDAPKAMSSRDAMARTVMTSPLYATWPTIVATDLSTIEQAIVAQDINALGVAAEHNALTMHSTMLSASPAICYSLPETVAAWHSVWQLRQAGISVYFTQDAGPNVKLLFTAADTGAIQQIFPKMTVISPFPSGQGYQPC